MLADTQQAGEQEAVSEFWQGKTPCWEMCHCSEVIRSECPATKYRHLPCWEIEGTYCKLTDDGTSGKDTSICQQCRVYKRWGQNRPIEIRLSGKGIDSFRRFLREQAEEALSCESITPGASNEAFENILRKRHEMYITKLDEIIDKRVGDGGSLIKVLNDIQDEYEWLPPEALEHVSERLEIPSSKVYRTAILGKGLSVMPRDYRRTAETICTVDLLKHYLDFLRHDLCGKCVPCREGMHQMYYIVEDISRGQGDESSLQLLKDVAGWVVEMAACNQGVIAANIVLAALEDCQEQFSEHTQGHQCSTGVCAMAGAEG